MGLDVGQLIWISIRPLLRLVITAGCGFAITKADIFPAVAARGAGQIMLNIALPCLMFSKIVTAFSSDNLGALAPLVLIAFVYQGLGIILAWLVGRFFWVPHRFRYGILVAGGWGNCGDIPTSVFLSVFGSAPFNGPQDQNLSVAYLSAFIFIFMITLFPLGGHRWIAMDYEGPDIEPEEVREAMRQRRQQLLMGFTRLLGRRCQLAENDESRVEKASYVSDSLQDAEEYQTSHEYASNHHDTSRANASGSPVYPTSISEAKIDATEPTVLDFHSQSRTSQQPGTLAASQAVANASTVSRRNHWMNFVTGHLRAIIKSLLAPASLAVLTAFPISLIPKVKALFVEVPGTFIHPAPDGQPPLAFLLDSTTFIGGASVPLGLICLGSALARLKVPRNQWGTLPIGAITWLAVGKLLVMPVLGVLIVQGLIRGGIISREDKVLQFVCIFLSCLPTASTQVILTQVYSGTGTAEHLSAFLIPQYIIMFVSMTALTAYTLQLLF